MVVWIFAVMGAVRAAEEWSAASILAGSVMLLALAAAAVAWLRRVTGRR